MASIQRIKNKTGIVWRAFVWVGDKRESARFDTKPQAVAWAQRREAEIANDGRMIGHYTVRDALLRYQEEVTDGREHAVADRNRINRLLADSIADIPVSKVTYEHGEALRDRMLERLQPESVRRDMRPLQAALRRSVRWRWVEKYPLEGMEQAPPGKDRTRTFTPDEIERIAEVCDAYVDPVETQMQRVGLAFLFALETGMRQGEILRLVDEDITGRVAHLRKTKNGDTRDVPLSTKAVTILERLPRDQPTIFGVSSLTTSTLFVRIRRKAGIEDATFHDSRRNATIALSKKFDIMELARVIGHKNIKQLLTYYQTDAEALAKRLD